MLQYEWQLLGCDDWHDGKTKKISFGVLCHTSPKTKVQSQHSYSKETVTKVTIVVSPSLWIVYCFGI